MIGRRRITCNTPDLAGVLTFAGTAVVVVRTARDDGLGKRDNQCFQAHNDILTGRRVIDPIALNPGGLPDLFGEEILDSSWCSTVVTLGRVFGCQAPDTTKPT